VQVRWEGGGSKELDTLIMFCRRVVGQPRRELIAYDLIKEALWGKDYASGLLIERSHMRFA